MALYCRHGCGRFAVPTTHECRQCAVTVIGSVTVRPLGAGASARCRCGASLESDLDASYVTRWAKAHECTGTAA